MKAAAAAVFALVGMISPAVATNAASTVGASAEAVTVAADKKPSTPVYFGVGCFWHVQHEFVNAEKTILGRNDEQLTSAAGYAGSTRVGKDANNPTSKGLVCYHNLLGKADYGKLGYGEVVQVQLPSSDAATFRSFADVYFSLFGADKERPDKGDRGAEYRSLVGIPGGEKGALFSQLQAAADARGLQLRAGSGESDGDTLGKKLVWVMDSDQYAFKQAEIYHQFHDGFFPGEQYPQSYNSLVESALRRGVIAPTGCPDV